MKPDAPTQERQVSIFFSCVLFFIQASTCIITYDTTMRKKIPTIQSKIHPQPCPIPSTKKSNISPIIFNSQPEKPKTINNIIPKIIPKIITMITNYL